MAKASLYPANPRDVPDDLTAPTSQYRMQTFMVLLALALFFLVYFGLMGFCVLYALWAVFLCPPAFQIVALVFIIPLGILFLYLLKSLFKFDRAQKADAIEIFEEEHPKLFKFIGNVCADIGAPFPKHVYVDFRVNAAALPDTTSIFHLVVPTDRSLLIGLGLVNSVNLTEFKAMLAHELGHFAQKGMKIGTYVYAVFNIYHQLIHGADHFDRFLRAWSQRNPMYAWPAYLIRGMLWLLKIIIGLMWYVVYISDLALGRQMEFNADLVAVSVTGSDAPVHLLYRCSFADVCFHQTVKDLRVAMDHHLYTGDLFYHQSAAGGILRRLKKEPRMGEPPDLPDDPYQRTEVFAEDDDRLDETWGTHPSSFEREQNAKDLYIRTKFDERSAWLLFDDVEDLRTRVTQKFYRFYFKISKKAILADPHAVQCFINDEHADRTYHPRYQGLYDNRNLMLKNVRALACRGSTQPSSISELAQAHAALYDAAIIHRAQMYYMRREEAERMSAVINGWHMPKHGNLEFRGEIYAPDDARRLLKKVNKELAKDKNWLAEIDARVFVTYFQMALHINQEVADELYCRYHFHLELQNICLKLTKQQPVIQAAIAFNNNDSGERRSRNEHQLLREFSDAHKAMKRLLRTAQGLTLPALKNLPAGQPLRSFLLPKKLVVGLSNDEQRISGRRLAKLIDQFNEMKAKVDRMHFKSLAGILTLQEKIGDECTRRWTAPRTRPGVRYSEPLG